MGIFGRRKPVPWDEDAVGCAHKETVGRVWSSTVSREVFDGETISTDTGEHRTRVTICLTCGEHLRREDLGVRWSGLLR